MKKRKAEGQVPCVLTFLGERTEEHTGVFGERSSPGTPGHYQTWVLAGQKWAEGQGEN